MIDGSCGKSGSFYRVTKHHVLNVTYLVEIKAEDHLACIFKCQSYDGCKAINFQNETFSDSHRCQLLGSDGTGNFDKLKSEYGWDLYEADTCKVIHNCFILYFVKRLVIMCDALRHYLVFPRNYVCFLKCEILVSIAVHVLTTRPSSSL